MLSLKLLAPSFPGKAGADRVVGQLDVDDQERWYALIPLQSMVPWAQLWGLRQHHMARYVVQLLLEGVDVHTQELAAAARLSSDRWHQG